MVALFDLLYFRCSPIDAKVNNETISISTLIFQKTLTLILLFLLKQFLNQI